VNIKERLFAAIEQRPVDCMPAMTYNFHPYTPEWQANEDGTFSGPPGYQPMMDAVLRSGMGMMPKVGARHRSERQERTHSQTFLEGDAEVRLTTLETPKGPLTTRFVKPAGQPGYYVKSLIESDDDLQRYLSLPNEPAQVDLSHAKEVYERLGNGGVVHLGYADPMYAVAQLFDFEDFCIRTVQQRSLIVDMIEREYERIRVELARMLEQVQGYDFMFCTAGPEVATPPMLSPDTFAALVMPYEKALVRMIHEAGQTSAIHCHGRVRRVLDHFIGIGIDALEPMEPPPQGDISLAEALEHVDGQICLMGYIQDQDLYRARPGEMRDKVRAARRVVEGRTGYIMTSTATPYMEDPPLAFVRNYIEYVQAATE
jgi:hypothetical protein